MRRDSRGAENALHGSDGYEPFELRVTPLAGGQELLTGVFKDIGRRRLPDRPFQVVIHGGFHHAKLGTFYWQELNLQVRYTLRHTAGEIRIVVPRAAATSQ